MPLLLQADSSGFYSIPGPQERGLKEGEELPCLGQAKGEGQELLSEKQKWNLEGGQQFPPLSCSLNCSLWTWSLGPAQHINT